jgi:hypothetical protein
MTPQPRDWRRVAEEVRDEKDSLKMMALVIELDRLLENEDKSRANGHTSSLLRPYLEYGRIPRRLR